MAKRKRITGQITIYKTSGTRHVAPVTNPMISHEWGKDREVLTINGTIHGHLWETDIP
jgi:hypothetical protein